MQNVSVMFYYSYEEE